MSVLGDSKVMDGMPPIEQAKKALLHALRRIRDHAEIGYYMGDGSQAFALLTEAYATLAEKPVAEIRNYFLPIAPRNPYADKEDES